MSVRRPCAPFQRSSVSPYSEPAAATEASALRAADHPLVTSTSARFGKLDVPLECVALDVHGGNLLVGDTAGGVYCFAVER